MSGEKGKGRASGNERNQGRQPEGQPSMLSRVAASATGLARSAFADPNSSELDGLTAAALAESGKGQVGQSSKSSEESAWAESSKAPQQSHGRASSASAFKVGHNEEHVRNSEYEFSSFLNGIDSSGLSEELREGHDSGSGLKDSLEEDWARSASVSNPPGRKPVYGNISEQQSRDGEDVLVILSQNGVVEETFEPPQEDEDFNWGLSAEQISQLRAMTKDLFPPIEAHGAMNPDHPFNLAPSFGGMYGQPPTASQDWIEQWDCVLNRYHDEVWGGLLPLVREARQEVEGFGNIPLSTARPKALRRLGAILSHLQQY